MKNLTKNQKELLQSLILELETGEEHSITRSFECSIDEHRSAKSLENKGLVITGEKDTLTNTFELNLTEKGIEVINGLKK